MMYHNIKQLLDINKCCALCGTALVPFLKERAYHGGRSLPVINCRLINDEFKFKLKYTSPTLSIDNVCRINLDLNQLIVEDLIESSNMFDYLAKNIELIDIVRVFKDMYPAIELQCLNNKCHNKYYLTTTSLKLTVDSNLGAIINPIMLDWECYNVSNLWIQNDMVGNCTKIYNVNKPQVKPIEMSMLTINIENKDKIFNKIKTIVNFG